MTPKWITIGILGIAAVLLIVVASLQGGAVEKTKDVVSSVAPAVVGELSLSRNTDSWRGKAKFREYSYTIKNRTDEVKHFEVWCLKNHRRSESGVVVYEGLVEPKSEVKTDYIKPFHAGDYMEECWVEEK